MIRVGKSDQVARKPSVELCPARPTALQGRVDVGGDLVVLTTEGAVSLHVALLEQRLQHDGFGVQRVDPPPAWDETRLAHPGAKERSDTLQKADHRRS
jgi:hypothetical protein